VVVKCFKEQKPFIFDATRGLRNYQQEGTLNCFPDMTNGVLICVPIVYEKRTLGLMILEGTQQNYSLTNSDINLLLGISSNIASAMINAERKRTKNEKLHLENQLQRSQKMEAIGTLAGGVAHDLNNILSGILSYPELILMELPQDSPLRKPLETIHESGRKAAAIVQELLTLARRGVAVSEVVNLNDLISEYLIYKENYEQDGDNLPGIL
jgi:signal transduction histidine kinase